MSERMNSARRVMLWHDGRASDRLLELAADEHMRTLVEVANRDLPRLKVGLPMPVGEHVGVPLIDLANPDVMRMALLPHGLSRDDFQQAIDTTIAVAHAPFN